MQIKDRDLPGEPDWAIVDEPRAHRLVNGFQGGRGFSPSSIEEEAVTAFIDFDNEPEELQEEDWVGEDNPGDASDSGRAPATPAAAAK